MIAATAHLYRCPYTGSPLDLVVELADGEDVTSGALVTPCGRNYPIRDGIPWFHDPELAPLDEAEQRQFAYYERLGGDYDATALDWLFQTFAANERDVREELLRPLDLGTASTMLEVGAGTCRDSVLIAGGMPPGSRLFLQDFSPAMLYAGRDRMRRSGPFACTVEYFIGTAAHLPLPDRSQDRLHHFGALGVFSDQAGCLAEMTRVVRIGGKVLVGDESLGPWLRGTEYGQLLLSANPLYGDAVPLDLLPVSARAVCLRYLLGSAFYALSFEVGDGIPPLDIDVPIPGARGGTLRSRRHGRLESVSPEAKELAEARAQELGISASEWLERAIRRAAQ
jgi:ubiquinone/menaquinone biosynthesis C-methylase UbiE/uncharacterized protein YbaR (Trm112 family)